MLRVNLQVTLSVGGKSRLGGILESELLYTDCIALAMRKVKLALRPLNS